MRSVHGPASQSVEDEKMEDEKSNGDDALLGKASTLRYYS